MTLPAPDAAGSRWSADAERYDRWFDQPGGRYASRIEQRAVLAAAGDLSGATVADVGCGTGRLTRQLEALAARVVGVDPDPGMLAVAARRSAVPLVLADGHQLPMEDGSFDVAVAVTVCEFATAPARVVAELARVTRPGGRVIIGALNRRSAWGLVNRRQFGEPPWSTATFLSRTELRRIGAPHGRVTIEPALYPPAALPLSDVWGAALERFGRRIAPHWGAFQVMTVTRPVRPPARAS